MDGTGLLLQSADFSPASGPLEKPWRVTQVLGNGCQRITSPASLVSPYPGAPSLSDGLGLEIGLYALANECQQLLKTTGDSSTVSDSL